MNQLGESCQRVFLFYIARAALILLALQLTACSSFNASIGVGYRKIPPEVNEPIIPVETKQVLTADEWAIIAKLLGSEDFLKHTLPEDNRVDFGIWFDCIGKK